MRQLEPLECDGDTATPARDAQDVHAEALTARKDASGTLLSARGAGTLQAAASEGTSLSPAFL